MWFEFLHGFYEPVVFLTQAGKKKNEDRKQKKKWTHEKLLTDFIL